MGNMEQVTSNREEITLENIISQLPRLNSLRELDDIMQTLNDLMEAVGKYTKADRAYIFETLPESPDIFSNTVEWCAEGVMPQKDALQKVFAGDFPYWVQMFKSGKSIVISIGKRCEIPCPANIYFCWPKIFILSSLFLSFLVERYWALLA